VYMPSQRVLSRDEILEPGPAAYHMLHSMNCNCPCLFPPSLLQSVANNRIAKEDDDTPDAEVDLILGSRCLQCPTTTNHIRASPHAHRADSTAGTGDVYIWDLSPHHKSLESLAPPSPRVLTNPWQRSGCTDMLTATLLIGLPDAMGRMASGNNLGKSFMSTRRRGGAWATGHRGGVGEFQRSKNKPFFLESIWGLTGKLNVTVGCDTDKPRGVIER